MKVNFLDKIYSFLILYRKNLYCKKSTRKWILNFEKLCLLNIIAIPKLFRFSQKFSIQKVVFENLINYLNQFLNFELQKI